MGAQRHPSENESSPCELTGGREQLSLSTYIILILNGLIIT